LKKKNIYIHTHTHVLSNSDLQISEHSVAELVCSVTINSYAKCVDIYPQPEPDIVASGHANGKIVLNTLSPPEFDYQGLVGREFCRDHYAIFLLNNTTFQ